jgi:hypothetical protein
LAGTEDSESSVVSGIIRRFASSGAKNASTRPDYENKSKSESGMMHRKILFSEAVPGTAIFPTCKDQLLALCFLDFP